MNQISGKFFPFLEGKLDLFDSGPIREAHKPSETIERFSVDGVRLFVLGRPETLTQLIVNACTLVKISGAKIILFPLRSHTQVAKVIPHLSPLAEPVIIVPHFF